MTAKTDPPSKIPKEPKSPGDQKPADPLAGQPLEVLIDALARFAGNLQGFQGEELKKFALGVAVQMQSTIRSVEDKFSVEATRQEAAAEVQQLVDLLVRTGTTAGKALEKHREPIANAFHQADIQQLAAGMKALSEWMGNPTAQNEADAKSLMKQLEATLGPLFGHDPKAQEAQRKQAIKEEAARGLAAARATMKVPDLKVRVTIPPTKKPHND